jgi:hypothetical protein
MIDHSRMFYKNLTNALHMYIQQNHKTHDIQILFLLSKLHFKQNILSGSET